MMLYPVNVTKKSPSERMYEILEQIQNAPKNSLILASELCFTGYEFIGDDSEILKTIQNSLDDKFFGFTHLAKKNGKIYNEFLFLSKDKILHSRSKSKLFLPNNEQNYFCTSSKKPKIFEVNGIKFGVLICFELRFTKFWRELKGADIVLVPAVWSEARKDTFITLCKALAITNFCYVVASSSLDLSFQAVFSPNGDYEKTAKFKNELIVKQKEALGIFLENLS